MGVYGWIVVCVGLGLMILRGLSLPLFSVDWVVVTLYFIFSIPFFARFLKKAKFPGTEFEFKDQIEKTRKVLKGSQQDFLYTNQKRVQSTLEDVQVTFDELNVANKGQQYKYKGLKKREGRPSFFVFNLSHAREIVEFDPVLALAALRIEIENKMKFWSKTRGEDVENYSLYKIIDLFRKNDWMTSGQLEALQNIIKMCNKAVHGHEVSYEIASSIIELTAEINKTFVVGYSTDFSPLENFEKYGLACPWEHCIENMPLENKETLCPLFGHECPGGKEQSGVSGIPCM